MAKQPVSISQARPFLKWAGGKTQLLGEFDKRLPHDLKDGAITQFVEPFIGGGAVFFFFNRKFSFGHCWLCDANDELVLTYRVIKKSVNTLVTELESSSPNISRKTMRGRELFYYPVRDSFNRNLAGFNFKRYNPGWAERAAQIIFLNRTCYNGLFRLNQSGEFNVPFGRYKKPVILNEKNLRTVAAVIEKYPDYSRGFYRMREICE